MKTGHQPRFDREVSVRAALQALLGNLAVVTFACLLALPCILWGIPHGFTPDLHINYSHNFTAQFWDGDVYPRWLVGSNAGYGSPIFLVQYPLPYVLSALIRPIVSFPPDASREARELGIVFFIELMAAGLAARFWLRRFVGPTAATLAALTYMALPYILDVEFYMRTSIGAVCTMIWMPLALGLAESIRLRPRVVVGLGSVSYTHLTLPTILRV